MEVFAKFNRIRNDKAKGDDIFVYEFSTPLEFYEEDPIVYAVLDNNRIEFPSKLTPESFYSSVLSAVSALYLNNKLNSVKVYNRSDFEDYFQKEVLNHE